MLAVEPAVPYLPEVVAAGTSPLILVTRRVRGTSLFKVVDGIDPDHAARQLARFLAALHSDQVRRRAEAAIGPVPAWYPLATTAALRERFGALVTREEQRSVGRWCDWADEILARPFLSRRCSCMATCMATTRSGPPQNCRWCSTSRTPAWRAGVRAATGDRHYARLAFQSVSYPADYAPLEAAKTYSPLARR